VDAARLIAAAVLPLLFAAPADAQARPVRVGFFTQAPASSPNFAAFRAGRRELCWVAGLVRRVHTSYSYT
jgi:hypothetical protein